MLRAILLDFDGVIGDTEPLHCRGFQKILDKEGFKLSKADYYAKYLGYDDQDCFRQFYRDQHRRLTRTVLASLVRRKSRFMKSVFRSRSVLLPGAKRAVQFLATRYPLAIVSGALRPEIQIILRREALTPFVPIVIGAEDVKRGKPHPEGYLKALKTLNRKVYAPAWPLQARECLVVEDSLWGLKAARAAGMRSVAVTSSYSRKQLKGADLIVSGIKELRGPKITRLEKMFN